MNIDRLKHLITILQAVPGKQFNLEDWKKERPFDPECGFTACAIGWAGLDPEFNSEGLTLKDYQNSFCPKFENYEHYEAVMHFFGINRDQAMYLFSPARYEIDGECNATPADVILRIEGFITSGGAWK